MPLYKGTTVVVEVHLSTLERRALLPDMFFKKDAVWWLSYQKKKDGGIVQLRTIKYPEML
ncbi:MAG: hypothetical protein H6936_10715 [Burkholderiales bacterium]|nr:hypothetical protein [Nitrosomonas sp.]MCP5275298.1 hypothetical protein [Burkholderiales bacterium]